MTMSDSAALPGSLLLSWTVRVLLFILMKLQMQVGPVTAFALATGCGAEFEGSG